MNGGAGDRRNGFSVTDRTANGRPSSPPASARASGSASTRVVPDDDRSPVAVKSRPVASVVPSTATSAAPKVPPRAANVPSTPHQVAERKRMRARSRSTTIRVATLWTRPADSRGMTFFQSTGETS